MRIRTHIFGNMLKFLITRYAVGYNHHSRTSFLLFHSDNEANAGFFKLFWVKAFWGIVVQFLITRPILYNTLLLGSLSTI